ncbi:alpha-tocopherol transfer protein-like [Nephila pilipes]|uniref:Alpha-tocopherol transfer protein-like n=1 Tax=Nephila pilipes TaxID=299642 RepID=A0A8X6TUP6_NEPPI|nr:alpha-tocopherol transfer protein-like [Nephila pilipes]
MHKQYGVAIHGVGRPSQINFWNIENLSSMEFQSLNVTSENTDVLPFEMEYLPDYMFKKCEAELKETLEKEKKLLAFRNILEDDVITSGINFKEDFLIQYLRHSKYDINKALKHLRNYVNVRRKKSYMFESFTDKYLSELLSTNFINIVPKRSPDGCAISILQLDKWNMKHLTIEKFIQLHMMYIMQLLRDQMNQINGLRIIFDFKGTGLPLIKMCSPQNLYICNHMILVR